MSSGLMDTEAGGENTQYESINTVTNPHSKEAGQLGGEETQADSAPSERGKRNTEKGERLAENMRYGQAISEQGVGGKTTESTGAANQDGFGGTAARIDEGDAEQTRKEQGYGGGSGVGA